jgi:hypothetical protein
LLASSVPRPGAILLPFLVLGVMFTLVMPMTGLYMNRYGGVAGPGVGQVLQNLKVSK